MRARVVIKIDDCCENMQQRNNISYLKKRVSENITALKKAQKEEARGKRQV